uniref:Uncharacterized protein n=1 Tax=Nicotiana tabacum TaxID=4097 RepID=A0A1S4AGB8_TOBAC|nr:putative protein TPRXL [Nicotiana tomentosiformis]XP_016475468.1 PREDICTED: putative protein TPRXL [Nicotiana tabacum]
MMIDDDRESSEEGASLHGRPPSSTQQTAQFVDTMFVAAASHPSTPSASSPSSPTLSPTTSTSSSSAASVRKEDVSIPQSPVHGNMGQNYASSSEDPQRRRSVTLSISTRCNLLS